MAKNEVKQKPKKMSKSDVKEKAYNFFNTLDHTSYTPETLIKSLYARAEYLLKEHDKSVDIWATFANLEKQVKKTWKSNDQFKRFWLDRIVEEFGYMLWNAVFNKYYREEWYQKDNLVEVPELPKKHRNNPENVAAYFADETLNRFKEFYL